MAVTVLRLLAVTVANTGGIPVPAGLFIEYCVG